MFKWKDSYSCNIIEIDNQHKRLFELGSKIHSILSLKDNEDHYDEIMGVLAELKNYTVYHFQYEEELMEAHGYSKRVYHKIEHDAFIDKISEIFNKDIDDSQRTVSLELIMFIADWIEKHILKTDFAYREFFQEKGIH